jgi:hypothetical protein
LRFGGEPVWVSDLDEKIIAVTTPTPCRSVSVDPSSASIAGIRWSSSLIRWVSVVIVEQAGGEPLELEPVGRAEPAGRDAILGKRDELREHAAGRGQRVADRNGQVDEHGFGLGEQPDALQDQGGAPVAEHGERLPGRARCGVLSGRRQLWVGQHPFLSVWPIRGAAQAGGRRQIWVESWQALFKPGAASLRSRGQPDTSNRRQPRGVNSVQSQGWPL